MFFQNISEIASNTSSRSTPSVLSASSASSSSSTQNQEGSSSGSQVFALVTGPNGEEILEPVNTDCVDKTPVSTVS